MLLNTRLIHTHKWIDQLLFTNCRRYLLEWNKSRWNVSKMGAGYFIDWLLTQRSHLSTSSGLFRLFVKFLDLNILYQKQSKKVRCPNFPNSPPKLLNLFRNTWTQNFDESARKRPEIGRIASRNFSLTKNDNLNNELTSVKFNRSQSKCLNYLAYSN